MATASPEVEARLSLHRLATARTRALHNDDRLYRAVREAMGSDRPAAKPTPREALKRRS